MFLAGGGQICTYNGCEKDPVTEHPGLSRDQFWAPIIHRRAAAAGIETQARQPQALRNRHHAYPITAALLRSVGVGSNIPPWPGCISICRRCIAISVERCPMDTMVV